MLCVDVVCRYCVLMLCVDIVLMCVDVVCGCCVLMLCVDVPKYRKFATFSKDLLAFLILFSCPAFCCRDLNGSSGV